MDTRALASGILVVLGAGCIGTEELPKSSSSAPETTPAASSTIARGDIERDLVLEIRRGTRDPYEDERDPRFLVFLVNRSRDRTYPIVLPRDGSESGWREPHVWFTVAREVSGGFQTVPPPDMIRCGLYANDWTVDVRDLAPSSEIPLDDFPFYSELELGGSKRIRVVAHYAYGDHARDTSKVPPKLHPIPAYTLASRPYELDVAAPYELEVKLKGSPLPRTSKAPLASAIDVIVKNRSGVALPFATSETGGQLWFEAEVTDPSGKVSERTLFVDTEPTYAAKGTLAPGAQRSLVGPATKTDVIWELERGTRLSRIRAFWRVWFDDGGRHHNQRRVTSPWLSVAP
jgi:hypothetical protein